MSLTVVKNATCTFCGCVCDDIELHADGERITKTKNACSLGESWFKNHTSERLYPDALIDGKNRSVELVNFSQLMNAPGRRASPLLASR